MSGSEQYYAIVTVSLIGEDPHRRRSCKSGAQDVRTRWETLCARVTVFSPIVIPSSAQEHSLRPFLHLAPLEVRNGEASGQRENWATPASSDANLPTSRLVHKMR